MDKKIFNKTAASLEEVNASLKRLQQIAETKKYALHQQRQSYKQNLNEKNLQIATLHKAVVESLEKISLVGAKIDMVIEENGSSNNHN